jgi:ATP-dependent DNA helicase RecQ
MEAERIPLPDPVLDLARRRFGIAGPSPWQRLVIANILEAAGPRAEGEDAPPSRQIVLLPTGAGKSLCFQLPALLLEGPSLVVYPLLALMEDQRRRLEELAIPHAVLRGGQDGATREEALRRAESGEARLILANPEVLALPAVRKRLTGAGIAHAALDEAHCLVEWGDSFRPAYRLLPEILEALAPRALSAFTATAGGSLVPAIAERLFGAGAWRLAAADPDRPNISYEVVPSLAPLRELELLARRVERPLLVFCPTRAGTELAAAALRSRLAGESRGEEARFYHAGLSKAEKAAVESWFLGSRKGILTATCAYGMGVDKKDLRSVIHLGLPATVEAYLQEAGRAGRDGGPARAILVAAPGEEERAARESDPGRRERREGLVAYARRGEGCRREALLKLLGAPGSGGEAASPGEGRACSGCDRCAGRAREEAAGLRAIRTFVEANPRRFLPAEAAELLGGKAGTEPRRCAGRGLLRGWRIEDIGEAIVNAQRLGALRLETRGPWHGRLSPPRRGSCAGRISGSLGALFLGLGSGGAGPGSGRRGLFLGLRGRRHAADLFPVEDADAAEDRGGSEGEGQGRQDAPVREDSQGYAQIVGGAAGHRGRGSHPQPRVPGSTRSGEP